ncbi:hypothetical protein ACQBJO_12685 [Janibacter sp. G349]|uniref:hypothetical protein n=1 Tax=Janibacter sp. G349 TaxID=3405424 RepID=UPI003B7EFE2E
MTAQGEQHLEPKSLGPKWWLMIVFGLPVVLLLMAILAFALSMLTRMVVEGQTDPDVHLPTVLAWFALCGGTALVLVVRDAWRELKDERVHVDRFGNELRIDRWSAPHERQRFAEQVTADGQSRPQGASRRDVAAPAGPRPEPTDGPDVAAPVRPRPEPTDDELRAAALRRREVGPGIPTSTRGSGRGVDLLGTIGGICLLAWLPALVVLGVVLSKLQDTIAPEWSLLSLLLLPIGWLLSWTALLLRHRWLRTRETRSDLAGFHMVTAFILVVVFVIVGITGLVMRDEALGVALISFPLAALCVWVFRHEARHHISDGPSGGGGTSHDVDLSFVTD